jgi:UDP-N-acetylglucosamine 2-epimerase (non-hydrolysing)
MKPLFDLVVGARPNFMKVAPVARSLSANPSVQFRIVHTGQHYDPAMNDVFFQELGIPRPDIHLDVGSGSHGVQTARIIERYEAHLLENRPAATVVFGDVNSTVACALAAVKLGVPVAHVEAGLRSNDRSMPEEINRILTDAMADLLLVSEPSGVTNLRKEGVDESKIQLVGNVMIDSLYAQLPAARARRKAAELNLEGRRYGFVTLHRPSNVDNPETLGTLLRLLGELAQRMPLVFAIHPRTTAAAERMGLGALVAPGQRELICLGPQPYGDTLSLVSGAAIVLTDSGGLQEETSVLGVPCLTLRENTERPVTVTLGTSRLVGNDPALISAAFNEVVEGRWRQGQAIPLWDGKAGDRISDALAAWALAGRSRALASA